MLRYGLYLVGLLFLVWTAYSSLTQVRSHERAVVRRFGRILEHKPQPGLHIGWPWGIDRVELAPVGRARVIEIGFSDKEPRDDDLVPAGQLVTGDHNLVNVQASIHFRIREEDIDKYVLQQERVDAFVARAAESLLAEWIAGREIKDVLVRGKSELPRFLSERLQDRLKAYDLGVEFEHASITKLDPPDQVKGDFDRVAQAQTNIRTQINQAEQTANSQQREADAAVKKIIGLAKVYADSELQSARADAINFETRLAQYRKLSQENPEYLNTVWREEMSRLYARMKEAGNLRLLDHFLTSEGLSITEFPLQPRRK
jgi:regulator of protease activity HflC (stomatin/prohibitin superfamily)